MSAPETSASERRVHSIHDMPEGIDGVLEDDIIPMTETHNMKIDSL